MTATLTVTVGTRVRRRGKAQREFGTVTIIDFERVWCADRTPHATVRWEGGRTSTVQVARLTTEPATPLPPKLRFFVRGPDGTVREKGHHRGEAARFQYFVMPFQAEPGHEYFLVRD